MYLGLGLRIFVCLLGDFEVVGFKELLVFLILYYRNIESGILLGKVSWFFVLGGR